MKHWYLPLVLLSAIPVIAQQTPLSMAVDPDNAEPIATVPLTLAELAIRADLVAVVRVLDTDYEYTREFPSGGTAFLQVLIPYKVSRPLEDIIEVYEEGLHAGECYFDNPTVFEEGRRHLVFLKLNPDVEGQYNGLPGGCKLDVLVSSDNLYALRFPVNGMALADDLHPYARSMDFGDEYAQVRDEDISPAERERLLQAGYLIGEGQRFAFTHGIELSVIRKLMGPHGLTLDRTLK